MKKIVFDLTCTIEKLENRYIAHCLEFDLVTEGSTIKEVVENTLDQIYVYLTYAFEKGMEKEVFQLASRKAWRKLLNSVSRQSRRIKPCRLNDTWVEPTVHFNRVVVHA